MGGFGVWSEAGLVRLGLGWEGFGWDGLGVGWFLF